MSINVPGSSGRYRYILMLGTVSVAIGIAQFVMVAMALRIRNKDVAEMRQAIMVAAHDRRQIESEMANMIREYARFRDEMQRLTPK